MAAPERARKRRSFIPTDDREPSRPYTSPRLAHATAPLPDEREKEQGQEHLNASWSPTAQALLLPQHQSGDGPACCPLLAVVDNKDGQSSAYAGRHHQSTYKDVAAAAHHHHHHHDPPAHQDASEMRPSDGTVALEMAVALPVPALPARNALRCLRGTHDAPLAKALGHVEPSALAQAAPHEMYLSSEEDASSAASDFSDFDLDSDSDVSGSSASHASLGPARVVSIIFCGKPSVVHVSPRSTSSSSCTPSSTASGSASGSSRAVSATSPSPASHRPLARLGAGRLSQSTTEPVMASSDISPSSSHASAYPPRTSSRSQPCVEKHGPDFLLVDPFSSGPTAKVPGERTVKAAGAVFKRTLSMVKKKRSRSAFHIAAQQPREPISTPTTSPESCHGRAPRRPSQSTLPGPAPTSEQGAASPETPTRSRIRTGFSVHRRGNSAARL